MQNFAENFNFRRPTYDDAQAIVELMIAYDIAAYGEPDYDLETLLDEWSDIDLERDAWIVFSQQDELIAYSAVHRHEQRFTFDAHLHPASAPASLAKDLFIQCEVRAKEQIDPQANTGYIATTYIPHVDINLRQVAEELGYQVVKYHFGMRITISDPLPEPVWPEGVTIRNAIPGQDDRMIYDFINEAFDWPGRTPPTFERWYKLMMGASNFDPDLWFLSFHGDELIGAILCFDYPQNGWVRQLGVAQSWRRRGLGAALLQHIFGVFHQRGHDRVGLVVESGNPKAYQFYENVGMQRLQQYIEYRKIL